MKYVIGLLGVLAFSHVGQAQMEAYYGSGDEEYYGYLKGNPVLSAEFEVESQKSPRKGITIKSQVLVDASCVEVSYDVHRESAFMHYIDYYVEDNGKRCTQNPEKRSASISLGDLKPGEHTVSIMGADGKDLRLKFLVKPSESTSLNLAH